MKFLLLTLITSYQKFISPLIKQLFGVQSVCRYPVTCSAYAKKAIIDHGALKGLLLALKRIVNCQPFSNTYGKYI